MGLGSRLLSIERRFAWGFFGFIGGTLLGVLGLYYALHEKRPRLTFEIVGQSNVLDVHQPLPDLSVLFRGADIQKSNLNLRLIHVRVGNDGESDILRSLYDDTEPLGLLVKGGRVLEVRLTSSSSPYLTRAAMPSVHSDSVVHFSKPILEPGKFFSVDLLVLHDKGKQPWLLPLGKIAGVDSLAIVSREGAPNKRSLWQQLSEGSIGLHLLRLLTYFFAGVLLLTLLAWGGSTLSGRLQARAEHRRAQDMRLLLDTSSPEEVLAKEVVIDLYRAGGLKSLLRAEGLLNEKDNIWLAAAAAPTRIVFPSRRRRAHGRDSSYGEADHDSFELQIKGPFFDNPFASDSLLFDSHLAERLSDARLITKTDASQLKPHSAFEKVLKKAIARVQGQVVDSGPDE